MSSGVGTGALQRSAVVAQRVRERFKVGHLFAAVVGHEWKAATHLAAENNKNGKE